MILRTAHFELHTAVLLFGASGLFGKLITASPVTIVFGRTVVAAVAIFIGLKLCHNRLSTSSHKSLFLMVLSGLVLALHWVTFFHAIQSSTVAIGLVGFATFPVFVTFLEPVLYGQKIRRVDIISAMLVVVGLLLVAPGFDLSDSGTVGLLWAVLSGALFAILTLINRHLVETNSAIVVAFYQHGAAALGLLPFVIIFGATADSSDIWLLLVLGVVCTALPHTLFIKSMAVLKAQLVSVVAGLEPVYGIVFAVLLLGEVPGIKTISGAAIVFGAVILAMNAHSVSTAAMPDKNDHPDA